MLLALIRSWTDPPELCSYSQTATAWEFMERSALVIWGGLASSEIGTVWAHDVQGIIGEEPTWWWNPLSFVTDTETAEKLADVFLASATDAGAKQDAYFESDSKRLLSHLFFAAAVGRRPITDVFAWAQDP